MSYLELTGIPEITDVLDGIAARSSDFEPVWPSVYEVFLRGELERFDAEGPGWAPLKPATVNRKGFATILVETGKMKASLTEAGAEGAVFRPGPQSVAMGTDYRSPRQSGAWAEVALASFHQEGTPRMVARPVIDPQDSYVDDFAPLIADWLVQGTATEGASVPA